MTFSRFAELVGQCCIQNLSSGATLRHYFFSCRFRSFRPFRGVVMRRTRKNCLQARANQIALPVSLALILVSIGLSNSQAAENATNFYILGLKTTMAGFTIPTRTYLIDNNYFFTGSTSGDTRQGI